MGDELKETRANEWYVPRFGPPRFRLLLGMTFFPYTLMNVSYTVIGSLLAEQVHTDRLVGIAVVYLFAVGMTAHGLDAMAPNKPWGSFLTRKQLTVLVAAGLIPSFTLGLYYSVRYAPWLLVVGVVELFFLLSYNLELFGSRFHTKGWFALSWGFLPVLGGYVLQTNSISTLAIAGGLFGFSTAYVEISASQPYKAIMKKQTGAAATQARRLEYVLKGVVSSVLFLAAALLFYRLLR